MRRQHVSLLMTLGIVGWLVACSAALAHEHHPPHAGTLVAFGDEFAHLELVLNSATGDLTGYVLDGEAENPLRLTQRTVTIRVAIGTQKPFAVTLRAVANALTGETVADTSEFHGLSAKLKGVTTFNATVVVITLRGKRFRSTAFNYPRGNEAPETERAHGKP